MGRFSAEDICFWINHNQQRIGGVCIEPNLIGYLFLAPPHNNLDQVLFLLKGLLLRWSDPGKPLATHSVNTDQLAAYCRINFRISESRRVMIRVTEPLSMTWPHSCEVRKPTPTEAERLATLFHECYTDGSYGVVVQRKYPGQGLASAMLRHALNALHPAYLVLRLLVTVGNAVEAVYHNLGFVAEPERYWLQLSNHG